nr:hypothetical protein [Tanacetum cinerariifolium]
MLLCKQEEAGIQLNVEQADWKDDTDDESNDQELEAHYMYMAKVQEVSLDAVDSGPIFDTEPEQKIDQNDEDADLAKERDLLASLIEKLKCEIDESKNRNKFLETSNKKSQAELKRRDSIEYSSKMELECAKVREIKNKLYAYQDTISILTQQKKAQIKLYKTREDKELEKVIELENKVKVLDNIVYKTGQSVQTMNMLNNKCRTSFAKPEYLKKAKQANPRLYDICFYNDNLALMLALESDEVIRLEKESRSKLSDLIKPFDYTKLNNLYDLFVPQREKSSEQRYIASGQSSSTASPQSNVPISTRLQLHEQALFCYYDAFLTSVEPKTYKEALTQACWIEAMKEELHEFKRLEVWELAPRPDKVMMDVKTAFLNDKLREKVYVSQPDGFVDSDN